MRVSDNVWIALYVGGMLALMVFTGVIAVLRAPTWGAGLLSGLVVVACLWVTSAIFGWLVMTLFNVGVKVRNRFKKKEPKCVSPDEIQGK